MYFSMCNKDSAGAIKQLFTDSFSDSEGEEEGAVIGSLVDDLLSKTDAEQLFIFIATEGEKVIGSVIFTALTFEDTDINAMILSPAAIAPNHQGKGVGQALITFALQQLKESAVELVITYGDPNFYNKVGFQTISETKIKAPLPLSYPEGWLGLSLLTDSIEKVNGKSYCVEALNNPQYW